MKSRTIILSLVLFTLLSTFQYANAQDKDPPPIQVIDPKTEPLQSGTPFPATVPQSAPEKTESTERSSSPSSPRSVVDDSGVFYIGDKQDPATAHGGDYYAVAYIEDGALHVTTFTEDLNEINTFYDLSSRASIPDIAYEASTGLFIVVWQYDFGGTGTDYDIRSLALDPHPFEGQIGAVAWVASSGSHNETMPSVDCNSGDSSCLVAYTHIGTGSPGIEGRFIDMTVAGASANDPTFPISTTIGNNPYVAMGDDGYLVAYTWDDISAPPYPAWPVYSHVYPSYQSGGGNQYMHDTMYLINPGDLQDDHDKYSSSVAYDACADKFVVLFTYDWAGDNTDLDVGARPVHKNSGSVSDYFWIAASTGHEASGDISFIEDYHLTSSPPYASKLVVAYSRWNSTLPEGIYATDLLSNCSETSPSYRKDLSWNHSLVVEPYPAFGSNVSGPSITGAGGYNSF